MIPRTYRLPKGMTAAWQSVAELVQIFGAKALGKPSIRARQHTYKVRIRAPAGLHDHARALSYLGLLNATMMGSVS